MKDESKTKKQLIAELVELRARCDKLAKKKFGKGEEGPRLGHLDDLFTRYLQSSPDLIALNAMSDGRFIEVNDAFLKATGYTRDEVIGRTTLELDTWVASEERDRVRKTLAEKGMVRDLETRVRGKEGRSGVVRMNADLVSVGDEECILTVSKDITDQKLAEEALRQSEARYRSLVEHALDAIVIAREGKIVFLNPNLAEISGYSPEEIMSRPFIDFIHPEDGPKILDRHQRRMAGEDLDPKIECRLIDRENQVHWTEFHVNVIDWEGRPAVLALIRDISERKRAEETLREAHDLLETRVKERTAALEAANAQLKFEVQERRQVEQKLRESEKRYRFLAENMADIVWTLDMNFMTTYVSPSVEKVLGFTPEERKRQTLEEMITPESIQNVLATFMEQLQYEKQGVDPERSVTVVVEYFRRDGSTIWMENMVKALRDENGILIGMYGTSRDISSRRQAEADRERLINELQAALVKVKTLRGLIPICSNCKKVRNDEGYWQQVEVFVQEHSEAEFSRSMCPECMQRLYPTTPQAE